MLTAWEAGRMRDLIDNLAESHGLDEEQLITLLLEASSPMLEMVPKRMLKSLVSSVEASIGWVIWRLI